MESTSTTHNTFVLDRVYTRPPARVFAAVADPAKKRRWFAEGEHHIVEEFQTEFRVGGAERLRYRLGPGTPFPGLILVNEGLYLDIVLERRVVMAHAMTLADRRISAALVTIELHPDPAGTRLVCTFQAAYFEGADGPQIREMGWKGLLDRLGNTLDTP